MRIDPRLIDPDDVLSFPPDRFLRTKPLKDRRPRVKDHTPREAVARGFRINGRVETKAPGAGTGRPEGDRGVVRCFSEDGRQAYVRWDADPGRCGWMWLSELEAL